MPGVWQIELEHRDKTIAALKEAIGSLKERHAAELGRAEAEAQRRAEVQHKELEATLQRQLGFVDRLLKDKAELAAQCEKLAEEMQAIGKKHAAKLAEVDEEAARELKRQKEVWAAAEKAKRDKWQAEKSKEIKALTLKGLEPEVQRMIEKQKLELKKMEERMAEELRLQVGSPPCAIGVPPACVRPFLLGACSWPHSCAHFSCAQRDQLAAQAQREADELKARLTRERECAVEREREVAAQRVNEANVRFDQQLAAQRLRWVADSDHERQEIDKQRREERRRLEDAQEKLMRTEERRVAELKVERETAEAELRRRHATEVRRRPK